MKYWWPSNGWNTPFIKQLKLINYSNRESYMMWFSLHSNESSKCKKCFPICQPWNIYTKVINWLLTLLFTNLFNTATATLPIQQICCTHVNYWHILLRFSFLYIKCEYREDCICSYVDRICSCCYHSPFIPF